MNNSLLVRPGGGRHHAHSHHGGRRRMEIRQFLNSHTERGETWSATTGHEEVGVVLLGGRATVRSEAGTWESIGGRVDVFDGLPWAVYMPPGVNFEVTAETDLQFARCGAPAETGVDARALYDRKTWKSSNEAAAACSGVSTTF